MKEIEKRKKDMTKNLTGNIIDSKLMYLIPKTCGEKKN